MILTADKGVSMVVMDKEEYIQKSEELLSQSTYKTITTDPTTEYKNKYPCLKPSKQKVGSMKPSIKAISYRGRIPQILWITQATQRRDAIKTHFFQHRVCDL